MPFSVEHFIHSFIHLLIACLIRLCAGWTRGSVCPLGAEGPLWEISYGFRTVVCVVTEAWLCLEHQWGQGEVREDSRTEAEINLLQVDKYRRKMFQAENRHVGWMQWVGELVRKLREESEMMWSWRRRPHVELNRPWGPDWGVGILFCRWYGSHEIITKY